MEKYYFFGPSIFHVFKYTWTLSSNKQRDAIQLSLFQLYIWASLLEVKVRGRCVYWWVHSDFRVQCVDCTLEQSSSGNEFGIDSSFESAHSAVAASIPFTSLCYWFVGIVSFQQMWVWQVFSLCQITSYVEIPVLLSVPLSVRLVKRTDWVDES